jgi:predicted DCC family thiol-disulfide oxidoreductase YuxK
MIMEHPIILFDGVCNLCNGAVQYLLKHDKKRAFLFASLQSETGKRILAEHGLPRNQLESIIYVSGNTSLQKSDAILSICKELGGWFKLLTIFSVIPKTIRDSAYDRIATNRYKWFGKQDHCMIPTPELKRRFLD